MCALLCADDYVCNACVHVYNFDTVFLFKRRTPLFLSLVFTQEPGIEVFSPGPGTALESASPELEIQARAPMPSLYVYLGFSYFKLHICGDVHMEARRGNWIPKS